MISPIATPASTKASFPPLDPAKAKKAEEIKARLQQSLDALKQSKNDVSEQRKSMAADRVARLKAALKALKQTPGMDPKAMAKMVARLAKELASAVREYKAAGGSETAVSAGASAAPAPASSDPLAESATPDASSTAPPAAAQVTAGVKAYQQTQQNTAIPSKSNSDEQDDAFIKDAKQVLEELKSFAKLQKIRIKLQKEAPGMADMDPHLRDVRITEKALADVEKILAQIAGPTLA